MDSRFWIGVNNTNGAGWKNVDDGSDTFYFDWANGEPVNSTGSSDRCVSVDFKGFWYSEDCSTKHFFMCGVSEISSFTTPRPTSSPTGSPLSGPCHAYIPFGIDISSDIYDGIFDSMNNFILVYFIQQLFPTNLQPGPLFGFTNETFISLVPDDISNLLTYTSAILKERGPESANLSL